MKHNNYNGALQFPVNSGFGMRSTAADVISNISLAGKVAIVTGGNTGIGLETTITLAAAGATVIVPARDVEKARKNLNGISNVEIFPMDLMDHESIDTFAEKFLESGRPLHLLINNAGIMWVPLRRDKRGFESQLVSNYFGQFQLAARLWPALKRANGARVINVSSRGHHFAPFNFDDPNFEHTDYETLKAYGQSKTASNLFAIELDKRGQEHHVRAYSVHPGSIAGTELAREASPELFQQMGFTDDAGNIKPEVLAALKTIPQGAATTVWAATSELLNEVGGVYCEDCDVAALIPAAGADRIAAQAGNAGVEEYSLDQASAKRLWIYSEKLLNIRFEI